MKIAILSSVAGKSSKRLANALKFNKIDAVVVKPNDGDNIPEDATHVFSYGCSTRSHKLPRLNAVEAIRTCVDKPKTFDACKRAGVSHVEYTLDKQDIPRHWDWVVIRDKQDGRKAEGLAYAENIPNEIPDGVLFTEYYEHRYEYRIVVFRGKVVGRYYKREDAGDWYFNNQPAKGFELMDKHCIKAAKEIGIDYVGFDVVAKDKKTFKILEANSAALLTDEGENAIVEYYLNLEG